MALLTVIVPLYNEQDCAQACYERLTQVLSDMSVSAPDNKDNKNKENKTEIETKTKIEFEIIFVNDGSRDNTLSIIQSIAQNDNRLKIISLSRNFGQQAAFSAGLEYAKGDAVIFIDADLQDPPEVIPELVKKWLEGYQIIYGKRIRRKGESVFKLLSAKIYYKLLHSLADVKIPHDTGDFRLIDRCVADTVLKMPEHNRFLRGMTCWTGFKQTSVEYHRDKRVAGQTKYGFFKMIRLATDGIFAFSAKPLKLVSLLGSTALIASLLLLIYVFVSIFAGNTAAGWASIICVIMFFGGIQLLALGIIGEYIARIFDEVKGRPNYIVDFTVNISDDYE